MTSYEHFGQAIRSSASDVRFVWVEGDVVDSLVEFLSVGRDFLDARFTVQIP